MKHSILVKTNQGVLEADLLHENRKTIVVRLPDGNIIRRHKDKHLVGAAAGHLAAGKPLSEYQKFAQPNTR